MLAGAQSIRIRIAGRQGHAAHPHRCIDPILIAGHIVCALQSVVSRELSPLETGVLTLGQIHGGTAGNIIPEEVVIDGTVRALSKDVGARILESARRIVEGTAAALRGRAVLEAPAGLPPVVNDDALFDRMTGVFTDLFGTGSVRTLPEPSMGGEDFALFLEHVPGAHFRLGGGGGGTPGLPPALPGFLRGRIGIFPGGRRPGRPGSGRAGRPMNTAEERGNRVQRVLLIVLACNLLVSAAKIAVGLAANLQSVLADGFHSISNGFSNVDRKSTR